MPGSYGGWWMFIWPIIFIAIIVFLFYWLNQKNAGQSPFKQENALDILKKRYARGEITKEEFERMKKDLL
ncbi:MAG TPA: SHOCT domain-containing protein [Balneolales bacterium]|nr:SHOCT domain-containing protein [Balneolales bacterium]